MHWLVFTILLFAAAEASAEESIKVFQSEVVNGRLRALLEKPAVPALPRDVSRAERPTYVIIPEKRILKMDGYGANLTESCTINLLRLPRKMRDEVMQNLFSKRTGAGFDFLRLPLGATDFADGKKGSYTYDDAKEDDPQFKQLDLSRDEKSFRVIQAARKINPKLHVMISPWTAPAWMKTENTLHGGGLAEKHYQDYANYFVKVIRELQERRIPVDSLTVQNEPFYETKGYPSMAMTTKEMGTFIGDYLGPALEKAQLSVRIFSHDHNWSLSQESNEILANPAALKYTFGVAYHCYWGEKFNMYDTYNAHPEKVLLQTECTGTESYMDGSKSDPVNDFGWWLDNQSIGAARLGPTGTSGALGWNLCLDEHNGPQNGIKNDPNIPNGGCVTCRGMVKMDFSGSKPKVIYNGEFYALAQVSRFIDPDSHSVELDGDKEGLTAAAFVNADGTVVLAVHNSTNQAQEFRAALGQKEFRYELPALGAATFLWKK